MAKRAQGLPLTTIVIAALALLVLIAVATFTMGGFGKIFGNIARVGANDIQSIQAECAQLCSSLQSTLSSKTYTQQEVKQIIKDSLYCRRTFQIGNSEKHCWDSPINAECEITVNIINSDGTISSVKYKASEKCSLST